MPGLCGATLGLLAPLQLLGQRLRRHLLQTPGCLCPSSLVMPGLYGLQRVLPLLLRRRSPRCPFLHHPILQIDARKGPGPLERSLPVLFSPCPSPPATPPAASRKFDNVLPMHLTASPRCRPKLKHPPARFSVDLTEGAHLLARAPPCLRWCAVPPRLPGQHNARRLPLLQRGKRILWPSASQLH